MEYSEIIRDLLISKKLSQQQLANILGVNQTTISQWILGNKKPSYDNILAIYEKFGITPNELFGINE